MTTATSGARQADVLPKQPRMRLVLDARPGSGSVSGGVWSPRTRHPVAELSDLVADLASHGVIATRLSVSVADWDATPGRLHLDDRDVRLIWHAYRAPHTVLVRHGTEEMSLAIVPLDAPPAGT